MFREIGKSIGRGFRENRIGPVPRKSFARGLQHCHLIPQPGEVDMDLAGFRVLAADCYFGRGRVDGLAFHGVEGEIFRCHADAQAGRDVAGRAG